MAERGREREKKKKGKEGHKSRGIQCTQHFHNGFLVVVVKIECRNKRKQTNKNKAETRKTEPLRHHGTPTVSTIRGSVALNRRRVFIGAEARQRGAVLDGLFAPTNVVFDCYVT